MKLYETPALDFDVGKMDISAEASFVPMHEILFVDSKRHSLRKLVVKTTSTRC